MSDTPEILDLEAGESGSESMDGNHASETLREIASETQSSELLAISELVATSQDKGEAGVIALEAAISHLSDIDTAKLSEDNPDVGAVSERLDKVYSYLLNLRAQRQMEITLYENARQVVDQPAPGLGGSPESRAQAARLALERALDAGPNPSLSPHAGSPGDALAPGPDPLAKIQDNFGPPAGQDLNTFRAGFTREAQVLMEARLLDAATARLRSVPDGEQIEDTVLSVIGNHPAMAQEILGFMGSAVASRDEIMRMPFTALARKANIELPAEILTKLRYPTSSNPPLPG